MRQKAGSRLTLIAACAVLVARAGAQIPTNPPPHTPAALLETIAYSLDSAAISAGIPILRLTPNPKGIREVRLWIHGWYYNWGTLYRVTSGHGTIRGEVIEHWPVDRSLSAAVDTIPSSLRETCNHFTRRAGIATCRARFEIPPDWRRSLREAETAGLWVIPDESELPKRSLTVDGWGMFVELRDGNQYRAYSYSNPNVQSGHADFKRAVAVVSAFRPIRELMRRSPGADIFRGLYVGGSDRTEFTQCGSDTPFELAGNLAPLAKAAKRLSANSTGTDSARLFVEVRGTTEIGWVAMRVNGREFTLHVDSVLTARPWTPDACQH
jgi:hypothetical protein